MTEITVGRDNLLLAIQENISSSDIIRLCCSIQRNINTVGIRLWSIP